MKGNDMFCYKDMTFCCAYECPFTDCFRHECHTISAQEEGWPIAWSDFSDRCIRYKDLLLEEDSTT